jgi:putative alpha-1,2-mannosidase
MPYDHDLEVTRPWYYSTFLLQDGITVEFTPGRFTGYYRFTFPANVTPSLLLDLFNDGEATGISHCRPQVEGMETWQGGSKCICMVSVDHDATPVWTAGSRNVRRCFSRARRCRVKYAISFISAEQAKKNFQEEIAGVSPSRK